MREVVDDSRAAHRESDIPPDNQGIRRGTDFPFQRATIRDLAPQFGKEEERKTELEDSMKKKGQHENLDNVKVKVGIEASSAGDKKNFEDNEIKNSTSNETLDNNKKLNKETSNKEFLLFINVAKIKGVLYKKYLDKVIAIDPNVKLCRDEKNRIEIYFGPFEKNEDRTELLNKLLKNKFTEAYPLEFTKEEFDKRCNY